MPNQIVMPQIPDVANTAINALQLKESMAQGEAGRKQQGNAAALQKLIFESQQRTTKRKEDIETKDFALNLLSGVNSAEDLEIARGQFNARYPEYQNDTDKVMSDYSPRKVELIRNSLRDEATRVKQEEIKAFGPGSALFKGDEPIGQVPFSPKEGDFEVFEGKGGDQVYVQKGNEIPKGYKKVQTKGTSLTVNTGELSKATKSKTEQGIIEADQNLQSFKKTKEMFKPEFLTMFGKGGNVLAITADKVGISTEAQKKLISERTKWFRQAKADFISYRKWATGVAGGEKEYKELATSFPDPVRNSPQQYISNLENLEETTKAILHLNKKFLKSGIDLDSDWDEIVGGKPDGGGGKTVVIKFDEKGNRIQ